MTCIEWMKSQFKYHLLQSVSRHNASWLLQIHIVISCLKIISWKSNFPATRPGSSSAIECQPLLSRSFPQGRKKAQSFLSAAQEALKKVGVDVWKIEI